MTRIFSILIAVLLVAVGHTASAQYSDELLQRAQDGDAEAQFNLGYAYFNGEGVIQDYAEAIKLWRLAAEQGNAGAQFNLGVVYANGEVVMQDYAEAVRWYRLAAEQGSTDAQINLGIRYALGEGVIQDFVYAHMWLNISASLGEADAAEAREFVAKEMTPEQISRSQELARECVRKEYKNC